MGGEMGVAPLGPPPVLRPRCPAPRLLLDDERRDVVELGDRDGGSLAHVGVHVAQRALERRRQVLDDLLDADAAHRADGQCADERGRVLRVLAERRGGAAAAAVQPSIPATPLSPPPTHLDERVDGHDRQVGVGLGVVDEVEVDELLHLDVVGAHAVDDVWEERVHVLAHRDGGDDLLHGVLHDCSSSGSRKADDGPVICGPAGAAHALSRSGDASSARSSLTCSNHEARRHALAKATH